MKSIFIVLIVFLCMTGCAQNSAELNPDEILSSTPEENLNTDIVEPDDDDSSALNQEYPTVFDFAILSEDNFPRGMITINQLISKYGKPKSVKSDPYYIITVIFDEVRVTLKSVYGYGDEELKSFSFFNDVIEAESEMESNEYGYDYFDSLEFDLNEADKNLELKVINLSISDKNQEFPNGIKIGESTKPQIISAYPVGSQDFYYTDGLLYWYEFRDTNGNLPEFSGTHGSIIYMFDENEILREVSIWWHWFSK